jgi:hypothetical protein
MDRLIHPKIEPAGVSCRQRLPQPPAALTTNCVALPKGFAPSQNILALLQSRKGSVFLAIDTMPGYTDTAALLAPGASAVWKYKGIYREADVQVGQWSDVVSTPVMR